MRAILFAFALLIFTASAHAASSAPHAVECKPDRAVIDGHEVTTKCSPDDSYIYQDWSTEDGYLDRADGPAFIVRDAKTGTVAFEQWRKNGYLDRPDGPAVIERDPATGIVTDEQWWEDGKRIAWPHAADFPAIIAHDVKTGKITQEGWFDDGYLDRADGPAVTYDVERDPATGTVTVEKSYRNGQILNGRRHFQPE
jgi:hypothetical protein